MPEITPTLSAQATAPSKPGTQAGFAAQTVAQLSHGAQVQPVSSEPADESMSDQADGMEASSDESDELESQSLPESSPADHIMQASAACRHGLTKLLCTE